VNNSCRLCGSTQNQTTLYTYDDFYLAQCGNCSFVYVPAHFREKIRYEDYKKDEGVYNSIKNSDHTFKLHRHFQRIKFFSRYAPGKQLLDVGSGWGHFLLACEKKGFKSCGLELAEFPARFSREELGLNVSNQNFFDFNPVTKFDVITSWDVLEHIDDIHGFIRKCSSLQNSGGIFVFQVPAFDSPVARNQGKNWKMIGVDHVNYFTRKTLQNLLEKHGYEIIKHRYNLELKIFLTYTVLPLLRKGNRRASLRDVNYSISQQERQDFFNRITRGSAFKKKLLLFFHDVILLVLRVFNYGEEIMVIARKK